MTDLIDQKNQISNLIVDLLEDDSPHAMESIADLRRRRKLIEQKISEKSDPSVSFQKSSSSLQHTILLPPSRSKYEQPRISLKRTMEALPIAESYSNNHFETPKRNSSSKFENQKENVYPFDIEPEYLESLPVIPRSTGLQMRTPKTPLRKLNCLQNIIDFLKIDALKNPEQLLKTFYHEPDLNHWSRMDFPWTRNIQKAMKL